MDEKNEIIEQEAEDKAEAAEKELENVSGGGITVEDWIVQEYEVTL